MEITVRIELQNRTGGVIQEFKARVPSEITSKELLENLQQTHPSFFNGTNYEVLIEWKEQKASSALLLDESSIIIREIADTPMLQITDEEQSPEGCSDLLAGDSSTDAPPPKR